MARSSSSTQGRQLSLTEELEKLEQQITLTLQEIDHNFSRAHRIVTTSVLPIVEQYASHSRDVWDGSKFWKQFFESSANVSLSGYEEDPSIQHDQSEATTAEDSQNTYSTALEASESYSTPTTQQISTDSIAELDVSNMTLSPSKSSTPRPSHSQAYQMATFADHPSPYEALRLNVTREQGSKPVTTRETLNTPGRHSDKFCSSQIAITPQGSPVLPPAPTLVASPSTARKNTDPLLHRVLDRNYRIQATPLKSHKDVSPHKRGYRLYTQNSTISPNLSGRRKAALDPTLSSSPIAPPELNKDLFSPVHKPRTPGKSILTPARNQSEIRSVAGRIAALTPGQSHGASQEIWEDSEDEDSLVEFDASPPKTIQFHVPQSRLLKTPAKEASRRIVREILSNAGVGREPEEEDLELDMDMTDYGHRAYEDNEASPSVVREAARSEDDTF